ncbi:DUF2919 domain-containing protein [Flocculibacter collagenilyticus]|uniref:DUF2919 domain-containing protein n=1 Tax=Flocculibacter collagenilyticus TaxID=2744479 RepID=UPI0018F7B73F|nr:DUF2919 domain-containing protein [Flocculibacter collagenilyticus]
MKLYTPDDFDSQGALKVPVGVYLLLILLLRAYVVWLVSLTQFNTQQKVIDWVYPNQESFFLSLISGFFALIVFVVMVLRRKSSPAFLGAIWRRGKVLLITSLTLDLVVLGYKAWQSNLSYQIDIAIFLVANLWCWLYLLRSRQVRDSFKDWPQDDSSS